MTLLTLFKSASPGVQAGVRALEARLRRHELCGHPLLLDILANDADRRSTAGCSKIGRRPKDTLPVSPHQFGAHLPKATAGYTLQAVHQDRYRDLGRVVHQQMHMVVFAVHFDQFRIEVGAYVSEDQSEVGKRCFAEYLSAVFRDEDQVDVHRKNAMSSGSIGVAIGHRPIYHCVVITRKANTYQLYPTHEQAQQMAQIAGSCRFVFNLALEQRRDWWKPGRTFNFASQCREVTALRAEVAWLKMAPVHTLQQAIKDLDRAYQNWWAGRAEYPTPRKKGLNDSFRFPDPVSIKVERTGKSSGRIKLPKLGWIRLRGWYAIPGNICNATVSRRAGQWHVAVQWQREVAEPAPSILPAVGIDRGVAVFAAMSDGASIAPVNRGKKALRALRKAQRNLSRKKRGSSNRRKAARRVAKIQMRVANARKDFLHKQTSTIANKHGVVVVEALKVRNMVRSAQGTVADPGKMVRQKAGLNRVILDQGWGAFRTMLGYKLADRGGKMIEVSAAYTSQTCAACGVVDAASRISQSRFVCTGCGHEANADTNAAINILRRADCSLKPVEGHRKRPVEAGSIRRAA